MNKSGNLSHRRSTSGRSSRSGRSDIGYTAEEKQNMEYRLGWYESYRMTLRDEHSDQDNILPVKCRTEVDDGIPWETIVLPSIACRYF